MISNVHYKKGWKCPSCENDNPYLAHLLAIIECHDLDKESNDKRKHPNEVWCVNKVCSKCLKKWTFKTDNSYKFEVINYEKLH